MNIYDAIMKAADRIEARPLQFQFTSCDQPNDCGTPGCALGWIGYCFGAKATSSDYAWQVAVDVLQMSSPFKFYNRMDELDGSLWSGWRGNAVSCAKTLRRYAEKYHGHEKPTPAAPNWNAMASKWTVGDDVKSQELVS